MKKTTIYELEVKDVKNAHQLIDKLEDLFYDMSYNGELNGTINIKVTRG